MTGPANAPAEGSGKRQRRREEVLDVAARLFFEQGYAATSTTDIARELGLHRGSIYYYLDTKEELLYELIQDRFSSGIELLDHLEHVEGDALAKLGWLIREHIKAVAENLIPSALALNESRSLTPEHRASITSENGVYRAGITKLITDGQRAGTIRADVDAALVTMGILGAANWLHRWYDTNRGAAPADVGRHFAAVFTRGLQPDPSVTALLDRIEQQAVRIAELEASSAATPRA